MSTGTARNLRERFLDGMSHAASTVNVVTTDGPAGRAGVTVSAMTSVSADMPRPTLLVCVHHESSAAPRIIENGAFCVNVLRDDQSYISDTFAGRLASRLADKFDCATWTTQITGAPRVVDPLVAFDCRVADVGRIGTHHVFIGEVEDIFSAGRGSPLIYANRAYGTTARIEPTASPGAGAGAEGRGRTLRIGCFHTFGPFVMPGLLARMSVETSFELKLVEGDHRRVLGSLLAGEVDLALVYDLDLGEEVATEALADLPPYVLLAPGHPLAARNALTLRELAPEPMVLLDGPPSAGYFVSLFTESGLAPSLRWRSASFEMVRGLVAHGLGYSLLATKPAASMSYDGRSLVTRPLSDPVRSSRVVLARRRVTRVPPIADAFARHCRAFFARPAAGERLPASGAHASEAASPGPAPPG